MNYTDLLTELNKASLFDLFRLNVAIDRELENPHRLIAIKKRLNVGMHISYFNNTENRLIPSQLLTLRQKTVIVQHLEGDHRKTIVPYFMLNIENVDTEIHQNNKNEPLTANNLRVGDYVGFNYQGHSIVGVIQKLNQKTVTLIDTTGNKCRVSYSLLHRIYHSETSNSETTNNNKNPSSQHIKQLSPKNNKNNSRRNKKKRKNKRK